MPDPIEPLSRIEELDDTLHKARSLVSALREVVSTVPDINNSLEAAINLAYLIREDAKRPTDVRRYATLLEEQLAMMAAITRPQLDVQHAHLHADSDRAELGSNGES